MKQLRNKETGENYETTMPIVFNIKTSGGGEHTVSCESITELNEKWEDVPEEPKTSWYIDCDGEVYSTDRLNGFDLDKMVNIGNRFNSREEANKAVEKLKAWKRLKDKGFRFDGVYDDYTIKFTTPKEEIGWFWCNGMDKDLDLLFGGEE